MKKILTLKYLMGALLLGTVFTACDKFEEDVPPAKMSALNLNDDYYLTIRNHSVQLNVLANDSIGGTATVQFGQPQHGNIATANGQVVYQPDSSYTGPESFTYQACLGNDCATAVVNIDVKADTINTCLVKAIDDIRTLDQNTYDSTRIMLNDNLCNGGNTTLTIVQGPAQGQAFLTTFKQLVYVPATNYVGTDVITYAISNNKGTSTAKVRYTINPKPQNCHLIARADSAFTIPIPGTTMDSVSVEVAANDYICPNNGPVTVQLLTQSTNYGTLIKTFTGLNTRIIYFTRPNAPANYNDTFMYRICQGNQCQDTQVKIFRR